MNTPENTSNLFQMCCILCMTDTKYNIVPREELPDDCAFGIDIVQGKTITAFIGFWDDETLNRIFVKKSLVQVGPFFSSEMRVHMDVCASDMYFGKTPVLEIVKKNNEKELTIVSMLGNILGLWNDVKRSDIEYGKYRVAVETLYRKLIGN